MTKSSKVFTVSAELLASHADALVQYLRERGDYERLQEQFSESVKALSVYQARERVPIDVVARNLDMIAGWINEPNLGLKVSPYSSRRLNRLDYFFEENRLSLIDYFRMLARYICISSEVMRIDCRVSPEHIRFRIYPNYPDYVSIHQSEGFVASLCDVVKLARDETPVAIDFAHRNPNPDNDVTLYQRLLGVTPAFNQPQTQILFRNDSQDGIAMEQRPSKASFVRIQAMEAVKRKEIGEERWIDRCRFLLEILMYYGEPQKTVLAELLAVTPRTLQRRLESEGITYRALLTTLRKELALRHLEDAKLTFNEVAFLLGYQDVGHFIKAFKGWYGVPPGRYRKTM